MRAADLFDQGVIPAEIARQVGVSHQIVSDWRAAWRRSGRDGLRGAGRAGRLPKLSRDQLAYVELELIKGAEANGYPNDVWTLQRVAEVIERVTGVSYHPAHVWYLFRGRVWCFAAAITVAPVPYSREVRETYHPGWRTAGVAT